MANGEIQKYYDMVQLQVAAESFLREGFDQVVLRAGNTYNSRFPDSPSLTAFLDRYELVAQTDESLNAANGVNGVNRSGFSAALFRVTNGPEAGKYILSIRSTEAQPSIADGGDIRAVFQAFLQGYAFGQLASLDRFFQRLKNGEARVGEDAQKIARFADYINAPGSRLDLSGYSLGGHLATAFTQIYPGKVDKAYLFNSMGTGSTPLGSGVANKLEQYNSLFANPSASLFLAFSGRSPNIFESELISQIALNPNQSYLSLYDNPRHLLAIAAVNETMTGMASLTSTGVREANPRIVDIYGANGISFATSSGIRHGQATGVFIEEQPPFQNPLGVITLASALLPPAVRQVILDAFGDYGGGHSIALLQDSLALMSVFEKLDPNISLSDASRVLDAGSIKGFNSLEMVLDSIRKILFGVDLSIANNRTKAGKNSSDFGNVEFRKSFYDNLNLLTSSSVFKNATGTVTVSILAGMATSELLQRATASNGLAYRYALKELNPFAILGPDSLYSQHNQSGALNRYKDSTTTTPTGMTDEYLADRVQMFGFANVARTQDKVSISDTGVTGAIAYRDYANDLQFRVFNPSQAADFRQIQFGSDAVDVLQGRLVNDQLYGGSGSDILRGDKANDYMEGGKDVDRYVFASGDGNDRILDTDGQMALLRNGKKIALGLKSGTSPWTLGGTIYTKSDDGKDLVLTFADNATDKITLIGFRFDLAAGDYDGIRLVDAPAAPAFPELPEPVTGAQEIVGDFAPELNAGTVPAFLLPGPPPMYVPDLSGHPDWRLANITGSDESMGHPPTVFQIMYTRVDANDNVILGTTPAPAQPDSLHDSAGKDKILAGDGDNTIVDTRGGDDWIVTGGGNDSITDSSGNNRIEAGAGNDTVTALGTGNDWIAGGEGNDVITDAGGTNAIDAGAGDDVVNAGSGDDLIIGGDGIDVITDAGGANLIEAGGARDVVVGGSGKDWVEGGSEGDILDGLEGDDTLWADNSAGQTLTIDQAIAAGEAGDQAAGPGDLLSSNAGDDFVIGAAGADYLAGGEGEDVIVGGAGDDTIYGDLKTTSANFGWTVTRTRVDAGGVATFNVVNTNLMTAGDATADGLDVIYGGAGADWIFAGAGDDSLDGGAGDDVLLGDAGNDALSGGEGDDFLGGDSAGTPVALQGDDYLDGGAGHDELAGDGGNDVLVGGSGDDTLSGGAGDDFLHGGEGSDILAGGAGKDTYVFNRDDGIKVVQDTPTGVDDPEASVLALGEGIGASDVKFRLGSLMVDVGQGDAIHFNGFNPDNPLSTPVLGSIQFADGTSMTYQDVLDQGFDLDGTEGDDDIAGTAVTDRIRGFAGNDIIEAGAGNDILIGGDGADNLFGQAGDDAIFAGEGDLVVDLEGTNTLDLAEFTALTTDNLEITQYQGADGESYLNYHVRDDQNPGVTPATGGVSVQRGELGTFAAVTLNDGLGGTTALTHAQLMEGYVGHGLVFEGSNASETLSGTSFGDTFFGSGGADTFNAGAGDDKLYGGAGDDTLSGGAGNDTFLLAYNGGRDTVIEDGTAEPNATHTVQLDAGIAATLVYARQSGDDLEVRLRAMGDALILKDFYTQSQSWQDGWTVKDANGATTALADYVPVTPPDPSTWIEEEAQAFRARREAVFAANRQADGYSSVGGNAFQKTEQVFSYSGRTTQGSTTTRTLVTQSAASDGADIGAGAVFSSTPLGETTGTFDIGLPRVRGAGGARNQLASGFGSAGAGAGGSVEIVYTGAGRRGLNGTGVKLNPGDYAVPLYAPRVGNQRGLRNAGSLDYANAGGFDNTGQYELIGYEVHRAGSTGSGQPGRVTAAATYQNYDQRLTVTDVAAGASDNSITAADASVVDGGAGNDTITLNTGYFFAGPDWEGSIALNPNVDSPTGAESRFIRRGAGFGTDPIAYPQRPNLLGGFAHGGEGDDTITGSAGQDVIAGGDGADAVDGKGGSDRYLLAAADTGVDVIADSGRDVLAYLDYYYWNRGIASWDERALHPNGWRLSEDGPHRFYFETEAEADDAIANGNRFNKTFIPALPEAAPVLTRDDPLYEQLQAQGVLSKDVLEFGPGLTLASLEISVTVDGFSAADHPERPWVNGGHVSVRWGADSGVDFAAPALNFGFDGADLLTGGWLGDNQLAADGGWHGYRLGDGIEEFRFADGATLTIDELLATATVIADTSDYVLKRNSGYQLVDARYAAIHAVDGIVPGDLSVKRDGVDLLIGGANSLARVRGWYADPQNLPQISLLFDDDPAIDAAALTARGLEVHGDSRANTLAGLDGFDNTLFGEGGDDTLAGGGGADTLVGGQGDDFLDGGAGQDTYVFNAGDGADTNADAPRAADGSDASVISFGPGITYAQPLVVGGALVLDLGNGDALRFNAFNPADPYGTRVFNRLEFDGGGVLSYEDVLQIGFYYPATEGNDVIYGTAFQDYIDALGGDDFIAGGRGDDNLTGGEGNDTYLYNRGDGRVDIADINFDGATNPGTQDTLRFGPDIAPQDLDLVSFDGRITVKLLGTADRIGIDESYAGSAIERFEFDDGTVWNRADIESHFGLGTASAYNDLLLGTAGDDDIAAHAGDDEVYAGEGDDIVDGGADNDFIDGGEGHNLLLGGSGDDGAVANGSSFIAGGAGDDYAEVHTGGAVIAFNPGDGHDTVYAAHDLTLSIGGGIGVADLSLERDGDDLVLSVGASDSIRLTRSGESDPQAWPQITLQLFGSVHSYDLTASIDGDIADHHLADSQTEALGGALSWQYATAGNLNALSTAQQRSVLADANFGTATQPISLAPPVNHAPVVSAGDSTVILGESVDASSLFSVSDADGDAVAQYEFWDSTSGNGHFSVNGVEAGVNVTIPVSAVELASTTFTASSAIGSDQVWVRANDGQAWSDWKSWNVISSPHLTNAAPEVSATATQTVLLNDTVSASSLFSATDADSDAVTEYEFWDSTAGSGHFEINGVEQGVNVSIPVSAAALADTQFVGASSSSTDQLWVRAYDGLAWSDWKSWNMNSWAHATNAAPVVTASDATVVTNDVVSAFSLFGATDADGDSAARYEFWDGTNGGGYFRVNGVQQGASQAIAVSASGLASTAYVGGASTGTEQVWVRANDGMQWSAWQSWNMTTALHIPNAAPVVTAADSTVILGTSVDAASLFSATDADGDAMAQYEFWDSTAGNGHFTVDGVEQGVNVAISVASSFLQDTFFESGSATGSDQVWVRANDGQAWSDWKSWNVTSAPHLTNAAPVVTALNNGLLRGEAASAADLFSVSDADGDAITQYEFWDDVNGGGQWRVNGAPQAAAQTIPVSAADLASTVYAGGANAGTEQVWVRAYDGQAWSGWKNWLMSTEGGLTRGGAGPDTLSGDANTPIVEGGGGADTLNAGDPNSLLNGGEGDDALNGGAGNDLLIGGAGDDTVHTGGGSNVIAYNAGDGVDTIYSDDGSSNALSLGGGLRYQDLSLAKDGDDLVLDTGGGNRLQLKDWYAGSGTRGDVLTLQMLIDASADFDASSSDPLANKRVQRFDFAGLVSAFDTARAGDPGLTSWALTNALLQYHLAGADDAALGGDLAYQYGKNDALNGIGLTSALDVLASGNFGALAQQLRPLSGLQEGFTKLS